MKRKLHISFIILAATSFMQLAKAQQAPPTDVARIKAISKDLAISNEAARDVWLALQTNKVAIDTVKKSKTMTIAQKQQAFKQLLKEREAKVNALLTLPQQAMLNAALERNIGAKRKQDHDKIVQQKKDEIGKDPVSGGKLVRPDAN